MWTAPRLHRALLDAGLDEAVRQVVGALPIDLQWPTLEECGLTPLDGLLSSLAAAAARDGPESDAADRLLDVLRGLGHGRVADLPTSTDDVFSGLPVLLALVEDVVPHVEVVLDEAWADRRRQYRQDTLQLLVDLAVGGRVEIVATPAARTAIWEHHRDAMPPSVTEPCNPRGGAGAPDDVVSSSTVEEVVATAREELNPDNALTAICRYCSQVDHDPTYRDLERDLALDQLSDSYARVAAQRLADLSLVERDRRPDGRTVVRLRAAGEAYVDAVSVQSTLGEVDPAETANDPPKILPTCRVLRAGTGGGDPAGGAGAAAAAARDADAGDRPTGEADAVATGGDAPRDDHDHGPIDVCYLPYPEQHAVLAAAEQGSVTLADVALEKEDDPRQGRVGYDPDDDRLVVSAEFINPLQYTASIARALTSWYVWESTDLEARLGDNFTGVTPGLNVLQDGRNLGWLTFEDADGARYRERLEDAQGDLEDMTRDHWHEEYDDRNEHRGEITRFSHGLIGTMAHLLELVGVDFVLECRAPESTRHFGPGSETNRRTLCKTLATTATIQARYGHIVLRRHLYEPRDEKVDRAIEPDVDPSDPLGTLPTAIVVTGDGVEGLQEDLRDHFETPAELREDAPEIAADIPIRTDGSVEATREAAEQTLHKKNLEPTPEAVALLHGLTRSPYAVTDALAALGEEPARRDVELDEVRYALSHLDEDQLWRRDATPTQQAGLKVLLEADEPISQAELSRRGGFSTQSWRNNREVLIDADLIRKTPTGWRLSLPFRDERYSDAVDDQDASAGDQEASADVVDEDQDDVDGADEDLDEPVGADHAGDPTPPWFVQERCDRVGILARDQRRPLDVLLELVEERLPPDDLKRLADPEDPVGQIARGYAEQYDDLEAVVDEVLDETDLGIVWPFVVASCGLRDGHEPVVDRSLMGPSLPQESIHSYMSI